MHSPVRPPSRETAAHGAAVTEPSPEPGPEPGPRCGPRCGMREAVLEPATFRLQKGAAPTALYKRRANFTTSTPDRRRARAQELQHTAWVRTRWTSELRSQRPALQPDSARSAAGNAGGEAQPVGHHSASRRAAALLALQQDQEGRDFLDVLDMGHHAEPQGTSARHDVPTKQRHRPTWAASDSAAAPHGRRTPNTSQKLIPRDPEPMAPPTAAPDTPVTLPPQQCFALVGIRRC